MPTTGAISRLGLGGFPRQSIEETTAISAKAASITWAGQRASIASAVDIQAKTGTIAWTGQKAAVALDVSITGKTGSISWTGQKATITASITITAKSGSIAWTGQKAGVGLSTGEDSNTGGWYTPPSETQDERDERVTADSIRLGIIDEPVEVETLPEERPRDAKGRFKRRLTLSQNERTRLLNELEAMAQADTERRQRTALLLLLL